MTRSGICAVALPIAIVCLLMAGCTAGGGEPVGAAPTPANPPTPPPANPPTPTTARGRGALAYGVDGDIYVADPDGSNAVRIADGQPASDCGGLGEYWGEGSIWSPDGRYLAYRHTDCQAHRDEWWDVVISDRKGNVVASFPGEGWLIPWSPDSTRVAVWVRWGETIGIYGLDGVRQTVLTMPPGWKLPGDVDPTWSPNGESLLVPNNAVVPIDGSKPQLTDRRLAWMTYSPDGSRVAYNKHRSLVVAAADGSQAQEVFGTLAAWSVWSPTGDRLAFVSNAFDSNGQLRVLDMATGTVTLLMEAEGSDMLKTIDFSPDGDRILFSKIGDEGAGPISLWSVNADGSDLRRLVAGTGWGDWRPQGPTH